MPLSRFTALRYLPPRCAAPFAVVSLLPSLRCRAPRRQIADSRKIKKMSRKQLKLIRKADTTGVKPILAAQKKRKK